MLNDQECEFSMKDKQQLENRTRSELVAYATELGLTNAEKESRSFLLDWIMENDAVEGSVWSDSSSFEQASAFSGAGHSAFSFPDRIQQILFAVVRANEIRS